MSMPLEPVIIACIVASIVIADRRLKAAAQPLRLRLAEKGEDFLQRRGVPDQAREHTTFLLNHAFGMRWFLILSLVAVPIVALVFAVRRKPILRHQALENMEADARDAFFEICRLHNRISLMNHWMLVPVLELELVLLMPLAIIVRSIIYGRVPESGGRESVISFIEYKQTHLRMRHVHASANSR
jgi:hypothetical protein